MPILILDELDSGIGARLGGAVGAILARMTAPLQTAQQHRQQGQQGQRQQQGQRERDREEDEEGQEEVAAAAAMGSGGASNSQIICVTHLPQVGVALVAFRRCMRSRSGLARPLFLKLHCDVNSADARQAPED